LVAGEVEVDEGEGGRREFSFRLKLKLKLRLKTAWFLPCWISCKTVNVAGLRFGQLGWGCSCPQDGPYVFVLQL
jgi:hypothetical protein